MHRQLSEATLPRLGRVVACFSVHMVKLERDYQVFSGLLTIMPENINSPLNEGAVYISYLSAKI